MRGLALAVALATGCVSTSQVGPYVKSVVRHGPWLVVHKCTITLTGDTLEEGTCTVEHVPLASVPMAPGPGPQPPIAPHAPMPPQPPAR